MIGEQTTGHIDGLHITAVSHQPPQATYQGRPVRLAIVDDNGQILAAGIDVAKEVEATVINCYRNTLKGQGFLRVHSQPIAVAQRVA